MHADSLSLPGRKKTALVASYSRGLVQSVQLCILPISTCIFNLSFRSVVFTDAFKTALIRHIDLSQLLSFDHVAC